MGTRLQALNWRWNGSRLRLAKPSPLPTAARADGVLTALLRRIKVWMGGPWPASTNLERRELVPRVSCAPAGADSMWTDVEPMPLCERSIRALTVLLDRHPRSRTAFCWLTVVENALANDRGSDSLAAVSPWVLRQAAHQLETLADLRREHDLVPLYLHMQRGSRREVPTVPDVVVPVAPAQLAAAPVLRPATSVVARPHAEAGVVEIYSTALQEILRTRWPEIHDLASRLTCARANDQRGVIAWAEEQLDGFRLRVLTEAAGSACGMRGGARERALNRPAIAAAELWLAATLDAEGVPDIQVAAILFHESASTEVLQPARHASARPASTSSTA